MDTIDVIYHEEDGSWWAESDDVPGFSALGASLAEARERVRSGLAFELGREDFDLREAFAEPAAQFTASLTGVGLSGSSSSGHVLVMTAAAGGGAPPADYRIAGTHAYGLACPA